MNIVREAFEGGEKYVCADCGKLIEKNHYPTTHVGTSAYSLWKKDRQKAVAEGISFAHYGDCNCDPYAHDENECYW